MNIQLVLVDVTLAVNTLTDESPLPMYHPGRCITLLVNTLADEWPWRMNTLPVNTLADEWPRPMYHPGR
jgi:hypothetical protein